MIVGTHNTMTYRCPKKWYLYPIKWVAQCQGADYKTQHEKYGSNAFDLRIFWDRDGNIEFRHGLISYDASDIFDILKYAEDNDIACRILFEERAFPKYLSKMVVDMNLKERFVELCKEIEERFPNLKAYSGRNTKTWEVVYKFKMSEPREIGFYSSVTSLFKNDNKFLRVCDDLCPRLYALLRNKKNKKKYIEEYKDTEGILHFDFINIS